MAAAICSFIEKKLKETQVPLECYGMVMDSATPIDDQYNRMRPRESQGITNHRGLLHNVSEGKPC